MVEKIDKPEPKSVYYIDSAPESKDDRGGRGQDRRDSDEYSGSHAAPGWQRVYASSANRRYLKLRRENIARAWFFGTTMQRGISLAEVHLETKDGRIIKNAHIVLSQREDFWTLKKFQVGQEVPLSIIIKEPLIEISIPQAAPQAAGSAPAAPPEQAAEANRGRIRDIIIYSAIGLAVLLLLIFLISR